MDFEQAELFAFGVEGVDGFFGGAGAGTHEDDDAVGIGRAVVVEEAIGAAGLAGEAVHDVLHDGRAGEVKGVAGFAGLEEDIGILGGAAQDGVIGGEGALAMGADGFLIEQGQDGLVRDRNNLIDFVRGAEAIKEVHERNARFESGQMGDGGEVGGFLHGVGGEHGVAGLAAAHDVGVVAEDGEGVGGDGAGGDMHDGRGELAGDLVHVGDHEQEALGGGKGGGEGSTLKGAVHGAGGAAFTLQLGDSGDGSPDIALPFLAPLVGELGHGGGGGNGVDGDDFGETVGDGGGGFVTVEDRSFTRGAHDSPCWGSMVCECETLSMTTTGKSALRVAGRRCDREHKCARIEGSDRREPGAWSP